MKKRALVSLFLALVLLAGCAPAAEPPAAPTSPPPTASPTPEPTPTPEPVDFREFLDGVNAQRKAVTGQSELLDISAYTPDFSEQNHTFTEEEMALLTTQHDPKANLTKEDLISDVDTFFTLLQTTYGAYHYFGGDDTFFPIRDAVKDELAAMDSPTVRDLDDVLYQHLSPVLVDGHFSLGSHAMRDVHAQFMYYVPGVYLDSLDGVENPDWLKPTIGPDGRICYWYAAMSHDGSDLPSTLDGNPLTWKRASRLSSAFSARAFSVSDWEGVPILISRRMAASLVNGSWDPDDLQALERLASCGEEYAGSPLLIFDVRGNSGGRDTYVSGWFKGWTGTGNSTRGAFAHRYSQLSCRINEFYPAKHMGTYSHYSNPGVWVERAGPTFVLQDKGVASSGETAVEFFRTAADTLFVGGPTLGCALTPNNIRLYLPHSGLKCYFGTGLSFCETAENRDGVGYLPDLWVEPTSALDAVKQLIEYYGLNTEQ